MCVRVKIIDREVRVIEIDAKGETVKSLLNKLGLITSEYVVLKNNMVVVEDEVVEDGDEIIVYPVKSGG